MVFYCCPNFGFPLPAEEIETSPTGGEREREKGHASGSGRDAGEKEKEKKRDGKISLLGEGEGQVTVQNNGVFLRGGRRERVY